MTADDFGIIKNTKKAAPPSASHFSAAAADKVRSFHESFSEYAPTPLRSLASLSEALDVGEILVKDESFRFGLNAFKVLGGSYAVCCVLCGILGLDKENVSFPEIKSALRGKSGITLITATDGNHGRGVAWAANRLGCGCVVYLPKGTAPERLENILKLGADASITPLSYDDAVRKAAADAKANGWYLIQDTSFEGYEEIPLRVMQGYTTMGAEISEALSTAPTHIFLQAGVGSMAGALTAYFRNVWGENPLITVVEPSSANCLYLTALADDGVLHAVEGEMNTIMAGLACGEPCPLAWDILGSEADRFVTIPDSAAACGMRVLGNPCFPDEKIISGESGASTLGFVYSLCKSGDMRKIFGIDSQSRILCISTEGDTDKANYRRIVWDGAHPGENK